MRVKKRFRVLVGTLEMASSTHGNHVIPRYIKYFAHIGKKYTQTDTHTPTHKHMHTSAHTHNTQSHILFIKRLIP